MTTKILILQFWVLNYSEEGNQSSVNQNPSQVKHPLIDILIHKLLKPSVFHMINQVGQELEVFMYSRKYNAGAIKNIN